MPFALDFAHPLDALMIAVAAHTDPVTIKGSAHSGAIHFFDAWRRGSLKNGRWRRVVPGVLLAVSLFPILYPITQSYHPDWPQSTCYGVAAMGSAFFGMLYKWVSDKLNGGKK